MYMMYIIHTEAHVYFVLTKIWLKTNTFLVVIFLSCRFFRVNFFFLHCPWHTKKESNTHFISSILGPAAYSQHIPTASGISWERVDTQQRNEAIPDLQNYHRLSLSNPPLDSQEFYVSSSSRSSPHIQLFQGSSDIQFSEVLEVSTSLTSNDTVQSDELHPSSQDLFQLSAAPNSLSCLQMVQVDAVLHHTPPEVLGASGQCSSHPSCSGNPFSSRTPPLLRSYDHQYELAHGHKNPHLAEDVINRESNETFRPLRTIGHQYKLSQ